MINLYEPLELDDGTPVEYLPTEDDKLGYNFLVRYPAGHHWMRGEDGSEVSENAWWHRTADGVFDGGNAERFYVVRNVQNPPPPVCEDWS